MRWHRAPTIAQDDLDAFERLIGKIQTAFSRGGHRETRSDDPEMLSYFSEGLASNAERGLRNELSNVKLLQGDLSEASRENGSDYATVAMRFSLIDATVNEANGRVVSMEGADELLDELRRPWPSSRRPARTTASMRARLTPALFVQPAAERAAAHAR